MEDLIEKNFEVNDDKNFESQNQKNVASSKCLEYIDNLCFIHKSLHFINKINDFDNKNIDYDSFNKEFLELDESSKLYIGKDYLDKVEKIQLAKKLLDEVEKVQLANEKRNKFNSALKDLLNLCLKDLFYYANIFYRYGFFDLKKAYCCHIKGNIKEVKKAKNLLKEIQKYYDKSFPYANDFDVKKWKDFLKNFGDSDWRYQPRSYPNKYIRDYVFDTSIKIFSGKNQDELNRLLSNFIIYTEIGDFPEDIGGKFPGITERKIKDLGKAYEKKYPTFKYNNSTIEQMEKDRWTAD